jgi:hypothetical protein
MAFLSLRLHLQKAPASDQALELINELRAATSAHAYELRCQLVVYRRHYAGLPPLPHLPKVGQ